MAKPKHPSAFELARDMKDRLPRPSDFSPDHFELADAVRDLIEAVVATNAGPEALASATTEVRAIADRLNGTRRDPLIALVQDDQGRLENLTQAGSGRLNPQAPRFEWTSWPPPPAAKEEARPVEVRAETTLTPAHCGPPLRVHGGVVATLLDVALGEAVVCAGAPGMTAGLNLRYRGATPYGVPLELTARYTHSDGRKSFATGEIRAQGEVTAEAEAIFVRPKPAPGLW